MTALTLTQQVIDRVQGIGPLTVEAVIGAKHCILDTLGVAIAGSREPVATKVQRYASAEGSSPTATVWGTAQRVSRTQAALLNGTAAHALDFDDVVSAMDGHPSAPVVPAMLAIAEGSAASGADLIRAFLAGFETEALVGALMKPSHYARGFHATATVGTFGAAAASAQLLGMDANTLSHALGIAGAHASGLKSMFGTMTKPLQVGSAAEAGVKAALLAKSGVTAHPDVLGAAQGFRDTQSEGVSGLPSRLPGRLAVEDVLFKYHAACYLTHSMIEGLLPIRREGVPLDAIRSIDLRVPPGHLSVCNIEEPSTPLEGKFSLKFVAASALATGDLSEAGFNEMALRDPRVRALMERVTVSARPGAERSTYVAVQIGGDRVHEADVDVNAATPPEALGARWDALAAKFRSLVSPVLGDDRAAEVLRRVAELDDAESVAPLLASLATTQ